jgi:hypothetical protein
MAKKANKAATAIKPAKAKAATADAKTKAAKPPKEKKVSALAAAAQVLANASEPMNCQALIEAMAGKGLWSSPHGKTPAATLSAAILREIKLKGKEARFRKTDRGLFAVSLVAQLAKTCHRSRRGPTSAKRWPTAPFQFLAKTGCENGEAK